MWVLCSTHYKETSHEINNSYAYIIRIKIFGKHIYMGLQSISFKA